MPLTSLRTRPDHPTPQSRSEDSFERQRADRDLKIRQEQLAAERADLATERRALERERQAWTEEQEQRAERRAVEQRTAAASERAEHLAGDLRRDVDNAAPGYVASLIINAARKAKGESAGEPLTGMAAAIVRSAQLAAGEIASEPALPTDDRAKAIILSGKRARGEPLAASDAEWLQTYCRKVGTG